MSSRTPLSATSMRNEAEYEIKTVTNGCELHGRCSSWYNEMVILNQTHGVIFMIDYTGEVTEIPPYYSDNVLESKVLISAHRTLGRRNAYTETFKFHPNKMIKEVVIRHKDLMNNAIYVNELDVAIAIEPYKDRLRDTHPRLSTTKREIIESEINEIKGCINGHTISVMANHPDPAVSTIYWSIGNLVMSAPVCHTDSAPYIAIHTKSAVEYDTVSKSYVTRDMTYTVDEVTDIFQGAMDVNIGSDLWVIGTSLGKVREMCTSIRERFEEEERQYKSTISKCNDEITTLKEEVGRLKSTIDQQKHEIKQQEYVIDRYRVNDQLIHDRVKMKNEKDIHELKVEKEALSTKAAESAAWSTAIKAAAVIVPSAIGITLALKSIMAGISTFLGGVWSFVKCTLPFMLFL